MIVTKPSPSTLLHLPLATNPLYHTGSTPFPPKDAVHTCFASGDDKCESLVLLEIGENLLTLGSGRFEVADHVEGTYT